MKMTDQIAGHEITGHEIARHEFAGHKNARHEIARYENARLKIAGQKYKKYEQRLHYYAVFCCSSKHATM